MNDPVLRIFSYLPNPRVWKSLIAAELCGLKVEVRGARASQLAAWLWDFDARPLADTERRADHPAARQGRRGFSGTLFKTDAFLAAQPFGTVPAAFSPDGTIGVFESNSILRAVARLGSAARPLYGRDHWQASRIDAFLDANLVFAREAQVWLLALGEGRVDAARRERMAQACDFYLDGVETALGHGDYLVGDDLSIADISFACDFAQFLREGRYREVLDAAGLELANVGGETRHPLCHGFLDRLAAMPPFSKYLGRYLAWRKP